MNTQDIQAKAIQLLQATNDGKDLTPTGLHLVELAVNRRLSAHGLALFAALFVSLVGCEAARSAPQGDAVEETPTCSILKRADDRNYCNGRCELIKNEDEKKDCVYWREVNSK